jgi:hypothetical protein
MKKFIALLILTCAGALSADAQLIGRFGSIQLIGGGTNNVVALASNSYSAIVTCQDVNDMGIQISCPLLVSNFCKPVLSFMQSADGVNFTSSNIVTVTCLGGLSTNDLCGGTCCYYTNLDVRGLQALKLFRVANQDYYGIMTNVTVTATIKR